MKKIYVFLCVLTMLFGIVGTSPAALMEYVFEKGPDSWVVGIDFAADGFQTRFSGQVLPKNDTSNIDFFYADYVSGTLAPGGGFYSEANNPNYIEEYNYGYERSDAANFGILQIGSQASFLAFYAPVDVSDWVANSTTVRIQNKYTDTSTGATPVSIDTFQNVLLTEIRPPDPVPEPATMLLLGTGLVGLAGFGRKKLLKKS